MRKKSNTKKRKRLQKVGCNTSQNTSKSGLLQPELNEMEKEVLSLITHEFLTINQVAIRLKLSVRQIYNYRAKLIKKGALSITNNDVQKKGGPSVQYEGKIRLHGEHYNIKILSCDDRYREKLSNGNVKMYLDGNTVMLYRNSINVFSLQSFYGKTPNDCEHKAMKYWSGFFSRLEHSTKCIIVKNRHQNITRIRAEFAEINNELAQACIKEGDKIRVVGNDGKVWLIVDNSFNQKELETTHRTLSNQDMGNVVQPFFNDLRENPTILSDVLKAIKESQGAVQDLVKTVYVMVEAQKVTQEQLTLLTKILIPPTEKKDKKRDKKITLSGVDYIG